MEHWHLTLVWVPGYYCILENEKVDEMARKAAEPPFVGPEPSTGLSIGATFIMALINGSSKSHNRILAEIKLPSNITISARAQEILE